MMSSKIYDVIVIGGGASGMMAAIAAAENGSKVLILEKNKRLGEKLRITGGGRCNIWNEEFDERLLLANYGKAEKFLYSSFARFGLEDTINFFSSIGIKRKVEARKRAFPMSERAPDVVNALLTKIKTLKIDVLYNSPVTKISKTDNKITSVNVQNVRYSAESYVLATGGASKPETGSTGDGFNFLKELNHKIAAPTPTITPLKVKDSWIKKLAGTTLADVHISFYADNKKAFRLDGNVLCTHFGISGPLILNNASKVADLLSAGQDVTATIDLYPSINEKQLDSKIQEILNTNGAKQLKNVLSVCVPAGVAKGMRELIKDENLDMLAADVSKMLRLKIVRYIKSMPLVIEGLMGFEKAVVADGGVNITEIDFKSMRSKKIQNLYVTGDLLHINRPSGGFSLQLCWTTGSIAGISASLYAAND